MKCWSVCLICCSVGGGWIIAQPEDAPPAPALAPAATGRPSAIRFSSPASQAAAAKLKEIRVSLDRFQRLLAMGRDEREKALAGKSDKQRAFLRRELQTYDEMPKEQRETELQKLRIWYYVRDLVKRPPEARKEAVSVLPATERGLVEIRLRRWDLLPADLQKEIMENERTIRYVVQLDGLSREEQKQIAATLPDSLRKRWDEKLEAWHALPTERRQRVYAQFQKFFELSPRERARVLETLSQPEREEAKRSLLVVEELEKLSPAERASCLDSLKNFFETPPKSEELYHQLERIQRWKAMTPKEKDVWKKIRVVLPPGLEPPIPGAAQPAPRGENRADPPAVPGAGSK